LKVVCDSTALIGLAKIDKVDLLKQILTDVHIPEAVFNEVVSRGIERPGAKEIDNAGLWICAGRRGLRARPSRAWAS